MSSNGRRINTKAMFQNIIGHEENNQVKPSVESNINIESTSNLESKASVGSCFNLESKPNVEAVSNVEPKQIKKVKKPEKNIQISIYVPPKMDKELSIQGASKDKEADKSAIARNGIEIVLGLSNDIYSKLKEEELTKGISKSKIIENALKQYLK